MSQQRPDLTQALRRVSEASLRYYQGWGQLSVDYLSSLFGLVGDLTRSNRPVATHGHDERPAPNLAAIAPAQPMHPAAMVLEGEGGSQAVGAFLVENRLARRVSAPVVASIFVGPEGREVRPHLNLDPEIVTLDPGEQVLVRVLSLIDDQLDPGVSYRGNVSVPGLGGRTVPLVLRRRVQSAGVAAEAPVADTVVPDTAGSPSPSSRKRRPGARRPSAR